MKTSRILRTVTIGAAVSAVVVLAFATATAPGGDTAVALLGRAGKTQVAASIARGKDPSVAATDHGTADVHGVDSIAASAPTGTAQQLSRQVDVAHGMAAVSAMTNYQPAQDSELPARAKAGSGVVGELDPAAMTAPEISLPLADGSSIEAKLQRVVNGGDKGAQSWVGTFEDAPGSVLVLTKSNGIVSGFANYKNETLEVVRAANGKQLLFAVDNSRLPKSDGVIKFAGSAGDVLSTDGSSASTSTTTASGGSVVQTLLVVYTAAAANAWGTSTLQGMIQSAVQSANQAYQNSQVGITLNLVGLQQTSLTESGSGMQATLSNMINNSEIQTLRNNLGANMVVLVSQDSDWCGYANLWISSFNGVTTTKANAVTYSSCLSNQTLAHEVGHLQGLDHDRADATGTHFYPYGFGYRVCNSSGFKDIMSYSCSPDVPRLLQFSNPNLYYNSYATGISYQLDPANAADNATALNNSAAQVAAYTGTGTTSTTTPPSAPSGLAASKVVYNSVSLAWSDNATNESGYKVERSVDGVTFGEIASLGSGAASFSDGSVAASKVYYYRVRAYNSAGFSAYSNTISVSTPAAPPAAPPAPTSVAAGDNANGTATVAWTVGTTNATSFQVSRQTYNPRNGKWGGSSVVATVSGSVRSIVDSSGTGTFGYSVAAVNAGGTSAYAGPAQVTVTNATPTSSSPGKGKKR